MIDTTKLRELAQAVKGWSNCNRFWNDEDHDNGVYIVGNINEDDEKYPLFEIDADRYGTDDESGKLAEFYAAANPATVLALLDELDRTRGTVDIVSSALFDAEKKVAKLYAIEAAARNLANVKGRHNSEIAMNQLLEALK